MVASSSLSWVTFLKVIKVGVDGRVGERYCVVWEYHSILLLGTKRKFTQTFFLEHLDDKYYVLNDIFRYLHTEEQG